MVWLPPQPSTIRHAGLLNVAICYRDRGQFDLTEKFALRAMDSFETEFPGRPSLAGPHFALGHVYFERGDFDRSAESFRRGLETEPYDWQARLTVVEVQPERHREYAIDTCSAP